MRGLHVKFGSLPVMNSIPSHMLSIVSSIITFWRHNRVGKGGWWWKDDKLWRKSGIPKVGPDCAGTLLWLSKLCILQTNSRYQESNAFKKPFQRRFSRSLHNHASTCRSKCWNLCTMSRALSKSQRMFIQKPLVTVNRVFKLKNSTNAFSSLRTTTLTYHYEVHQGGF